MADTMIERVTQALYLASRPDTMCALANEYPETRDHFRKLAVAAITAMRLSDRDTFGNLNESVIAMLVAGTAVLPEHDEPIQEDAANCWNAMIDAALGQEG